MRFEITEKTGYSGAWIFLFLLFIAGIVVWFVGYPRVTLIMAGVGLLTAAFFRLRGKKKIGGHLELTTNGMIFWDEAETRCIAFNEIKYVKYIKFMGLGEEAYVIETKLGNKRTVKPQDYEDCDQLRQSLQEKFQAFDCRILQ